VLGLWIAQTEGAKVIAFFHAEIMERNLRKHKLFAATNASIDGPILRNRVVISTGSVACPVVDDNYLGRLDAFSGAGPGGGATVEPSNTNRR
jgi:hypothetical protein